MSVYHLIPKPKALESPHWCASTYNSDCYVYADSLREAMRYANLEFDIAVSKPWVGEQPNNPWAKEDLVTIIEVDHLSGPLSPKGTVCI